MRRSLYVVVVVLSVVAGSCGSGGSSEPLPEPTGPYPVGVRQMDWLDDGPVTAWYPAEPSTGGDPPPYMSDELELFDLGTTPEVIAGVVVRASTDAAPAVGAGLLPIVIWVPLDQLGELSTTLTQELASHGYLTLVVEPTRFLGDLTAEERAVEFDRIGRVIDRLVAGPDSDSIGMADVARIGVGGHSAGAGAAFEMALVDPRITAVFDLDGILAGRALDEAVQVPALVVMTSIGLGGHRDVFPETFAILAATPKITVVGLDGADHFDVTDAPTLASVVASIDFDMGPIGPSATTSTAELVRRFLDGALVNASPTAADLVAGVPGATATADYLDLSP